MVGLLQGLSLCFFSEKIIHIEVFVSFQIYGGPQKLHISFGHITISNTWTYYYFICQRKISQCLWIFLEASTFQRGHWVLIKKMNVHQSSQITFRYLTVIQYFHWVHGSYTSTIVHMCNSGRIYGNDQKSQFICYFPFYITFIFSYTSWFCCMLEVLKWGKKGKF